jgi:hypothetical protein
LLQRCKYVLTKTGREELGLVVTNGGLTMSCGYAKVLCKLAHRFKWTDIIGTEANKIYLKASRFIFDMSGIPSLNPPQNEI